MESLRAALGAETERALAAEAAEVSSNAAMAHKHAHEVRALTASLERAEAHAAAITSQLEAAMLARVAAEKELHHTAVVLAETTAAKCAIEKAFAEAVASRDAAVEVRRHSFFFSFQKYNAHLQVRTCEIMLRRLSSRRLR